MKAILITQELKNSNFNNLEVGKIYKINPPKKFVINNKLIMGFDKDLKLQTQIGFKELIIPKYDTNTEKLGEIKKLNNSFIYEILELTEDEKDNLIPLSMPKLNFKIAILDTFNLKNSNVDQVINTITDLALKERINLMWYESSIIERKNPFLLQFLGAFNLTVTDINNIFKNYYNE